VTVSAITATTFAAVFATAKTGPGIQVQGSMGACLALINAAYTSVTDCLIYGAAGDGIRLENHNGSYQADEVNIVNNRIFSNARHGIYLLPTLAPVSTTVAGSIPIGTETVTPASMTNISVGATLIVANSGGSNLEYVVVMAVTATTFTATFGSTKTGPGITVVCTFGHVGDHVILGNHINYNAVTGIRGTRLTSTIIQGNNVLTNAIGIYLDAADRCTILGNACRNNKGNGIIIEQDQSGNSFGRSVQILIEANQLHYNGVTSTADDLDVWHTDGCQILGNYFGDTDFTPTSQYGIQLYSTTNIVISQNLFATFVHSAILANSQAYSAYGNVGLADSFAVPASTSALTHYQVSPTGLLTLVYNTATDVPGASLSLGPGTWFLTAVFCFVITSSDGECVGQLNVGGAVQGPAASVNWSTAYNTYAMASQNWVVATTGASTIAKLQALKYGTTGTGVCSQSMTSLIAIQIG